MSQISIASKLDLFLKWLQKGGKTDVKYGASRFKAVDLGRGISIMRHKDFGLVAKVKTRNGDTVYMTIPKSKPRDGFETLDMARKVMTGGSSAGGTLGYSQVVFPMIDLDAKPDISWLEGMSDPDWNKWKIDEAKQETKIKMDEVGARVREAVAIHAMTKGIHHAPRKFIINKPFLFAVHRNGLKEPFFSAYLSLDGWQNLKGGKPKGQKSVIGSFYTMSQAIDKLPGMKVTDWKAQNAQQKKFLEIYKNTTHARIPEIKSIIGTTDEVNAWLGQSRFGIKLEHGRGEKRGHETTRPWHSPRQIIAFRRDKDTGKNHPITASSRRGKTKIKPSSRKLKITPK